MPSYDRECLTCGLDFEVFVKLISQREDPQPCPECGGESKKVILNAPALNNTEICILSYTSEGQSSKRLKAGFVHSHGQKPVTKVSAGYGGVLNPSTRAENPVTKEWVQPEAVRYKKKSEIY